MAQIRAFVSDLQYVDLNNTPSYLSATTFSLGTADVTNFHVGRRVKLFDASTLYGTIDSISATSVSVRLDGGALTASLSSVALAVVTEQNNSLPDAVWNRRNIVINGQMDIWQRGSSFTPANSSRVYTADRFSWLQSASAAVNISRLERSANAANVPTIAQAGVLLTSSLCISVSAADAAMAAGEFGTLQYLVEGHDWRQIAHRPNVLSFWAKSNRSGIYAVATQNVSASASFVQNFTVDAANTWNRYSITIPEAPTNVTWNYSESIGLAVVFTLAAGSSKQGGEGNWTATNIYATSSQTNFLASAGNVFVITGVQLEAGSRASPLEIRHYGTELDLCKRYFTHIPMVTTNNAWTTAVSRTVIFPSPMRGTPNISAVTAAGSGSDISFYNVSSVGFRYTSANGSGATDFSVSADAEL